MKIKFNEEYNKIKNNLGKIETINNKRPWSEVIKIEGVQAGHSLEIVAKLKNLSFQTVSPRKIKIKGYIEIKTKKFEQKKSNSNIKLKWDKTLKTIPELHRKIPLQSLLNIPENKPDIKQVKTIKPELEYCLASTLINRILIKGEVYYSIIYYPDY